MNGLYFDSGLEFPAPPTCELVQLDGQLIPALLSALLGRAGPSHWIDEAAYAEGYSRLSIQGGELLMGCKEEIITEVRALRDSELGHAPYDLTTHPVGEWPGVSLRTLSNQLYAPPDTAAELLVQIRELLAQQAATEGESLEMLGQLVLLLGV